MTSKTHPFDGVVLTIPNLIRCADALKCFPKSAIVKKSFVLSDRNYDAIRNLYVKCSVAGTKVQIEANNPLIYTVLNEPEKWVKFGNFDGYNILYFRKAPMATIVFETSHPVEIKYENVIIVGNQPSGVPYIYQQVDDNEFVRYIDGCVGIFAFGADMDYYLKNVKDRETVSGIIESNFYKDVPDGKVSVASLQSHHLSDILKGLKDGGFDVSDMILMSYPPIGSCTFENDRREELTRIIQDSVARLDAQCKLRVTPKMNRVFVQEYKQKEIQRCEDENAKYRQLFALIRSRKNNNPAIIYP